VAAYTVTVRRRGAVDRDGFETLDAALAALEARLEDLAWRQQRPAERALARLYGPQQQVAVRGEIAGPGRLRGGVDVRGDGSTEAYIGRWRRRLVRAQAGESAPDALRRVLRAAEAKRP
jgi:hypothetical protein